jgi:hypothetical protein
VGPLDNGNLEVDLGNVHGVRLPGSRASPTGRVRRVALTSVQAAAIGANFDLQCFCLVAHSIA